MQKVIVIGGAGFIGVNLCLDALRQGMTVVVFDNLSRQGTDINLRILRDHPRLIFLQGDIRDADALSALLRDHPDAEAIFHLAGQVAVTTAIQNPREDFDINLTGTLNLLEAMRHQNTPAPLLFASTNKVYGGMKSVLVEEGDQHYHYRDYPHGIAEDFPLDFHSPYGCSKGGADQYVLDYARVYGLKTVVFRQSCIYGVHQFGIEDQGWVAWFTIAALFDQPITIFGDGKQVRDVLYIDDLIRAYWAAIEHIDTTRGTAYNIGGGQFRMSLLELLGYLETHLGKPVQYGFDAPRQGDQKIFVADTRKARADFGWSPEVSAQAGVRQLAEWAIAHRHFFVEAGLVSS